MKIRILKQTSISGQPARVGQVVDANDQDAGTLLAMGRAELVQDSDPMVITQPPEAKPSRTRKPRSS